MKWFSSILALFLSLAGCDHIALSRLKPGESTIEDVRHALGEPSFVWDEPDGQQVLEYAGVPDISKNQMLRIDASGILREMHQVVTSENFKRVEKGMTRDTVRRLLGKPYSIQRFARLQQEVWDWKVPDVAGTTADRDWRFNTHFGATGLVVDISQTRAR